MLQRRNVAIGADLTTSSQSSTSTSVNSGNDVPVKQTKQNISNNINGHSKHSSTKKHDYSRDLEKQKQIETGLTTTIRDTMDYTDPTDTSKLGKKRLADISHIFYNVSFCIL